MFEIKKVTLAGGKWGQFKTLYAKLEADSAKGIYNSHIVFTFLQEIGDYEQMLLAFYRQVCVDENLNPFEAMDWLHLYELTNCLSHKKTQPGEMKARRVELMRPGQRIPAPVTTPVELTQDVVETFRQEIERLKTQELIMMRRETVPQVKTAFFTSFTNQPAEFRYVITNDCCTFTAVDAQTTSSINAAEDIVEAICAQEGCQFHQLRFFDLQTHLGYSSKQPGHFEYDEVELESLSGTPRWIKANLPTEIRTLFAREIG